MSVQQEQLLIFGYKGTNNEFAYLDTNNYDDPTTPFPTNLPQLDNYWSDTDGKYGVNHPIVITPPMGGNISYLGILIGRAGREIDSENTLSLSVPLTTLDQAQIRLSELISEHNIPTHNLPASLHLITIYS